MNVLSRQMGQKGLDWDIFWIFFSSSDDGRFSNDIYTSIELDDRVSHIYIGSKIRKHIHSYFVHEIVTEES